MSNHWPLVALGDILTLERRPVKVMPTERYAEIGIYSFGRGIFHKEPRTGFEVGDKDLFLVKEGDFIFQITFAWEGAVGLASKAEDSMYGSTRFPTFRVNETICHPKYLLYYFKTKPGQNQLVQISPGTAGRNRVLSLKKLPYLQIPLPSLDEQHRIVNLQTKVEVIKRLHTESIAKLDALLLSIFYQAFNENRP